MCNSSVDLLYLLYSSANIGVSYVNCLVFAVWTLRTILPKFLHLIVLPLCVCVCGFLSPPPHEYSTYTSVRLHELCCCDSVCQITGDWRKLHNENLHNFYYSVNTVKHNTGRKRPLWLPNHTLYDNSKMDLGRTTYTGVDASKLWGISWLSDC
jgi:hypothetical protein